MPHMSVNGVNIYFETHGDEGEPLVLVHGYTGDITDWRHQIPEFSRTHRVLVMDHRGHGKSDAPADRTCYTINTLADDVEAVVEHAGFTRFHLLGHSMGGAVVQELALRSPQKLLSLTLHDTSYRFAATRSETVKKWIAARNTVAEQQGMTAVANMPGVTKPPPYMSEERKAEEKERLSRMSLDGFLGCWSALETWEGVKERAHEIAAPTLVIYGALDVALVEASKRLAAIIPGATLVEIPDAGHSPQYERPELFNAVLRAHLDRHAPSAAK